MTEGATLEVIVTNIKVQRAGATGSVEPSNGKWRLMIGPDGMPELQLRAKVKMSDGAIVDGWIDVAYLDPGMAHEDLSETVFDGELTPEEIDALDPADFPTVDFGR